MTHPYRNPISAALEQRAVLIQQLNELDARLLEMLETVPCHRPPRWLTRRRLSHAWDVLKKLHPFAKGCQMEKWWEPCNHGEQSCGYASRKQLASYDPCDDSCEDQWLTADTPLESAQATNAVRAPYVETDQGLVGSTFPQPPPSLVEK